MNYKLIFILFFVFVVGFSIGFYTGVDRTINYFNQEAGKFLNISLTPQGLNFVQTYGFKARLNGYLK